MTAPAFGERPVTPRGGLSVGASAIAIAVAALGCLYTKPINMRPSILDITGPAQVFRRQQVEYAATASDPDGEAVVLSWTRTSSPCPTDPSVVALWPSDPERLTSARYDMTVPASLDPFCVWVFATDPHGAVAARTLQVTPVDRAPVAALAVVSPATPSPYSLYARIELSAAASSDDDGDPLAITWSDAIDVAGTHLPLQACADNPGDDFRCFLPGAAGTYIVQVSVTDGLDDIKSLAAATITVADDQLPCLGVTSPSLDALQIVRTAGQPDPNAAANDADVFSVLSVVDDGDPFPGTSTGTTTFSWFLGRGTDPVTYLGRNYFSYTLDPSGFSIGDVARVRVEIADRNQAAVDAVLRGCGDQALCAGRPGCYQRATWTVTFR